MLFRREQKPTALRSDYDFETTLERLRLKQGEYYGTQVHVEINKVRDKQAHFSLAVVNKGYGVWNQYLEGDVVYHHSKLVAIENIQSHGTFSVRTAFGLSAGVIVCGLGIAISASYLPDPLGNIIQWVCLFVGVIVLCLLLAMYLDQRKQLGAIFDLMEQVASASTTRVVIIKPRDYVFEDDHIMDSRYTVAEAMERLKLKAGKYGSTEVHMSFTVVSPDWCDFTIGLANSYKYNALVTGKIINDDDKQTHVILKPFPTILPRLFWFILGIAGISLYMYLGFLEENWNLLYMLIPVPLWLLILWVTVRAYRQQHQGYQNLFNLIRETVQPSDKAKRV